ncbi:FG-GAP repeat protein [Strigomonas culicis]|uniref:FG-GAP repeat protein n=1 Tax=Strigomonas culicis TaxID=28005 RepID=S9V2Y8_9TRYP|nr:FG-GAP repeat protein [Strigomonas culicis]|eukprot:EPY21276.1 FG-GAP repeat protein [Strigomonas culicis]
MRLLFNPDIFTSATDTEAEEYVFQIPELRHKMRTVHAEDEVAVDAHILSTPVLTDIDGNGDMDAIVHVSYFFDPADFREGRRSLPEGINGDDYMATALVCINLVTGEYRWAHTLHLSRKTDTYPSYGLSTPLVVNADEDKSFEVYVSSTTGALHSETESGKPRPGWPVWLGPITASPAAEDVSGDGKLDVCVGDVEGKMSCFSSQGKLLWETHLYGGVTTHVVFGDVNQDGVVDVVFGTSAGAIYALNGTNGHVLPNFPIITGGSVVAPPLLLRLQGIVSRHLHLVVPSHDGHLYIVDGGGGCIETVDLDEKSSTMVLADDLTGNGYLDLVVTTLRGGVYLFETQSAYSALSAWPSETKGLNCHTASYNNVGISIEEPFRKAKDIRGDHFQLPIHISDMRQSPGAQKRYVVDVFVGPRIRIFHGVFREAKSYSLLIRAPLERMRATLTVTMTLVNGQTFTDSVALSFNLYFLETIKFTLIVPFVLVALALMAVHKRHEVIMSQQDELYY